MQHPFSPAPGISLRLLYLFLLFCLAGHAQDIDRKNVKINYVVLPLEGLVSGTNTYAVRMNPRGTVWGNSLGNIYDAEQISINGYYRITDLSDADLVIDCEVINDLVLDEVQLNRGEYTYKKNKDSPEIPYVAYYYYITYYTPKIRYAARYKNGKTIFESTYGGAKEATSFGQTTYENHYSSESPLANAWYNAKRSTLAALEKRGYAAAVQHTAGTAYSYGMYKTTTSFTVKYVDEKKGKTEYLDLRDALDFFEQAVEQMQTDSIVMINKLVQPDYEKRRELMLKAIAIWEKALGEADFENKKARIDSKVGRHLYFNLALAYLWIDDFAKAREYAQGRKKDLGSWDKNFLSGIKALSNTIDDQERRYQSNKWRALLTSAPEPYKYLTPAERQRLELQAQQAEAARVKAVKDSLALALQKETKKKEPAAKKPVAKPATRPAAKPRN